MLFNKQHCPLERVSCPLLFLNPTLVHGECVRVGALTCDSSLFFPLVFSDGEIPLVFQLLQATLNYAGLDAGSCGSTTQSIPPVMAPYPIVIME